MIGDVLPAYDDLPHRRPRRIVSPTGRQLLGDLGADPMLLWTFQSPHAYQELAETGLLVGDPTRTDPYLSHVYPWMKRQADNELPTHGPGMLWLWAATTRRSIIDQAKHAAGDVLLTVRLPRAQVLLSEFDAWHVPLNSGLNVPPEPGESVDDWWARAEPLLDAWAARKKAAGLDRNDVPIDLWPSAMRDEAEQSWQSIFDDATWSPGAHIQAVTHAIHAEQVVSATRVRRRAGLSVGLAQAVAREIRSSSTS